MIAVNPNRVYEYVLKSERELPADQQTTWKYGALTVDDHEACLEALKGGHYAFAREILRRGLRGWSSFPDDEGRESPFEKDEEGFLSAKGLRLIPPEAIEELMTAVWTRGKLSEDEKKP